MNETSLLEEAKNELGSYRSRFFLVKDRKELATSLLKDINTNTNSIERLETFLKARNKLLLNDLEIDIKRSSSFLSSFMKERNSKDSRLLKITNNYIKAELINLTLTSSTESNNNMKKLMISNIIEATTALIEKTRKFPKSITIAVSNDTNLNEKENFLNGLNEKLSLLKDENISLSAKMVYLKDLNTNLNKFSSNNHGVNTLLNSLRSEIGSLINQHGIAVVTKRGK
jgi:hypothetical protein